ncbi:unnamed protein product [Adineta steineri]|uniref:Transposase n=1 Tax=Adineta steineri TaxID=433720 RepID=A0A819CTK3_9BILA|nr:unnamed protein product [Adineta steineri]CAF3812975.1 unnamed protein product [Adineta steineri]
MLARLWATQLIVNDITYSSLYHIGLTVKQIRKLQSLQNNHLERELIKPLVAASKKDIPSRTILSPLSSEYPTITCDSWCDKYKHQSYICFTIHYLGSDIELHQYSLKTETFDGPHTGKAIKDILLSIINEFNLNHNNIIVVLDNGSNTKKA